MTSIQVINYGLGTWWEDSNYHKEPENGQGPGALRLFSVISGLELVTRHNEHTLLYIHNLLSKWMWISFHPHREWVWITFHPQTEGHVSCLGAVEMRVEGEIWFVINPCNLSITGISNACQLTHFHLAELSMNWWDIQTSSFHWWEEAKRQTCIPIKCDLRVQLSPSASGLFRTRPIGTCQLHCLNSKPFKAAMPNISPNPQPTKM